MIFIVGEEQINSAFSLYFLPWSSSNIFFLPLLNIFLFWAWPFCRISCLSWWICVKWGLCWWVLQGEGKETHTHCVRCCAKCFPKLLRHHPTLARWVTSSSVFAEEERRPGDLLSYCLAVASTKLAKKRPNKDFKWKHLFEVILCRTWCAFFFFCFKWGLYDAFSSFLWYFHI